MGHSVPSPSPLLTLKFFQSLLLFKKGAGAALGNAALNMHTRVLMGEGFQPCLHMQMSQQENTHNSQKHKNVLAQGNFICCVETFLLIHPHSFCVQVFNSLSFRRLQSKIKWAYHGFQGCRERGPWPFTPLSSKPLDPPLPQLHYPVQ